MTEMDEKRKEELRVKIEYQVSCEEKAFRIVERLIENPISSDFLLDAVQFITPNHYTDVTEERAVSRLCGYPICQQSLAHIPKQKYFISTKSNKVYDIENRKNFCSGRCYKASKHLEQQISTEPVWSRKNHTRKRLELLPLDMKTGQIGDEVVVSKRDAMTHELGRLSDLDQYGESLKDRKTSGMGERNVAMVSERRTGDNEDNGGPECVYTLDKALAEMGITEHEDGDNKSMEVNNCNTCDQQLSPPTVDACHTTECVSDDKVSKSRNQNPNQSVSKVKHHKTEAAPFSNLTENTSKIKQKSTQSKTDYLMQLLNKKKSLLAQMADIQPQNYSTVATKVVSGDKPCDVTEEREEGSLIMPIKDARSGTKTETGDSGKTDITIGDSESQKVNEIKTGDNRKTNSTKDDNESRKVNAINSVEKTKSSGKSTKSSADQTVCESVSNSVKQQQHMLTVVDLVCEVMQSWLTCDTTDYLKDGNGTDAVNKTPAFTEQYRALVAKVDAQEYDLSNMIGEESMAPEEGPSAPAPHYEFLKEEADRHQLRVREFMKGSFTYKDTDIAKKEPALSNVQLPTVDKYDQMLIRQKIVLEKISKVLPDILAPLHLLQQDVFTELKELVFTFNFTSENILLKPAEWTLVTIMLLKMLSNKVTKLQQAFLHPGADRFFTKLLTGLGESGESLDRHVASLLALG